MVELFCAAMIVFKVSEVAQGGTGFDCAKTGEEGFFFVGVVAPTALIEVMESSGCGFPLFLVEWPAGGLCRDGAEDVKESLNAAVAVFEHAEGIVESTVWFCANSYGHGFTCGRCIYEVR